MLPPGSRIGGLLIGDLLGRGAMGEVYRGVQLSLKRPVAIKRIAAHLLDDADAIARFAREAQCVARVQSQHVVSVYEFGQFPDQNGHAHYVLVMELVDGGMSLRKALNGPLPWRLASSVILQVAEGLMAAAEHGVVHRDIKPDNIMLTRRGVAKLCDFGLARSVDSTQMTMEGSLLGTPNYMPPEACRGEAVGAAGDLYSLGATWYHILSGRPPFSAGNTLALLRMHLEDEPTAISSLAEVPAPIAALVHRCLAKDPQQRPPSAQWLYEQLAALNLGGPLPRSVPELIPVEATATADDPSTVATLISQDATLSQALAGEYATVATAQPASTSAEAQARHRQAGHAATIRTLAAPVPAANKIPALVIAAGLLLVIGGGLWLAWYVLQSPPKIADAAPSMVALGAPVTPAQAPQEPAPSMPSERPDLAPVPVPAPEQAPHELPVTNPETPSVSAPVQATIEPAVVNPEPIAATSEPSKTEDASAVPAAPVVDTTALHQQAKTQLEARKLQEAATTLAALPSALQAELAAQLHALQAAQQQAVEAMQSAQNGGQAGTASTLLKELQAWPDQAVQAQAAQAWLVEQAQVQETSLRALEETLDRGEIFAACQQLRAFPSTEGYWLPETAPRHQTLQAAVQSAADDAVDAGVLAVDAHIAKGELREARDAWKRVTPIAEAVGRGEEATAAGQRLLAAIQQRSP